MALASRLRHELDIERYAPALDGLGAPIEDDYGQTQIAWSVLATVRAWVQPMSAREQLQASGAGPVMATHKAFILPTDVKASDRLKHGAVYYSIDEVIDPAGRGRHLELLCHQVGS